jgi:hypothetical protein
MLIIYQFIATKVVSFYLRFKIRFFYLSLSPFILCLHWDDVIINNPRKSAQSVSSAFHGHTPQVGYF